MPGTTSNSTDARAAHGRFARRLRTLEPGARVIEMLRSGDGSRPDVAVVVLDGVECVVKDHHGCDPWFSRWLGPMLSRREVRALVRLASVQGVPRVVRRLDSRAFAMTRLDARPYRQLALSSEQWREFFSRMEALVDDMHARGVAHCDLRSPDNTLVTPDGSPVIVDFVASYTKGSLWKPWSSWMFARLCEVDRSAIDKQKRTVCPELLDHRDVSTAKEGAIGWLARNFGVTVRQLARLIFTRRR